MGATTTSNSAARETSAHAEPTGIEGKHVCPFCGVVSLAIEEACPHCKMNVASATRAGTKALIGPWYVLQTKLPSIPGVTFARLLELVRKGRIQPRSVVRGPTTHQFWRFAIQVKGLSREFGLCYDCGAEIASDAETCPACSCSQSLPTDPHALLETNTPPAAPEQPDWSHEIAPAGRAESAPADSLEPMFFPLRAQYSDRPNNVLASRGAIATAFNLQGSPKARSKGRKRMIWGGLLGAVVLGAASCFTVAIIAPDSSVGQWLSGVRANFTHNQQSP
jgi:hypothetical protein